MYKATTRNFKRLGITADKLPKYHTPVKTASGSIGSKRPSFPRSSITRMKS